MWKGAAETLKASPQTMKIRPNRTPVPASPFTAAAISSKPMAPEKP